MLDEAALFIADVVLEKCLKHRQFNLGAYFGGHLLDGKRDSLSEEMNLKINDALLYKVGHIQEFLMDEKYFRIENQTIGYVVLTEKGEKAKELGGHEKYKSWERKQNRKEWWVNAPKQFWWLLLIVGWAAGFFLDIGKEALKRKIWPVSTQEPQKAPQNAGKLPSLNSDTAYLSNKAKDSTK
jgi:hypothetical protein